jgi:ABC-type branched-subunit amino acid transport system ATPase component/branched-subunit amino acid ABC-type transport system permease component
MHVTIQLLIAGITVGSAYALAALGLVVVYKGSGVLNFAQGAIGMVGTYIYALVQRDGYGMPLAVLAGLATSAAIGAATYMLIMRPLRAASMLSKVIATLGLMLFLEDVALVIFGNTYTVAPSPLPTGFFTVDGYFVSEGGLVLLGLSVACALALGLYYRRSVMGLATEAASLNEPSAMRLGYQVNRLASFNWAIGSVLAAAAGILLVQTTGLDQTTLTSIIVVVMGAAVLGGFRSLWLTLIAAEVMGLIASRLVTFSTPGLEDVLPFVAVFIALLWRSDVLPSRTSLDTNNRLPVVPPARIRPVPVVVFVAAVVVLGSVLDQYWQLTLSQGFAMGIIGLSFVLLTGYVGQISLAQWVFAGVGGLFGVALGQNHGLPILLVLLVSAVVGFGIGMVTGISALRIRGIALAVVTLVAANAIQGIWFVPVYDLHQVTAPVPELFGLTLTTKGQYFFDAVILGLAAVAIWLVRRAKIGRRLLAVRASERAAAASGFSITRTKLLTFGASAALAAVGGALYGYAVGTSTGDAYTGFQSVLLLVLVYLNGVGSLAGGIGVIGAIVGPALLNQFNINQNYFGVVVGVLVILNLIYFPDGVAVTMAARRDRWAERMRQGRAGIAARIGWRGLPQLATAPATAAPDVPAVPDVTDVSDVRTAVIVPAPRPSAVTYRNGSGGNIALQPVVESPVLVAEDVSVVYGSVEAVSHVSLELRAGEVVGLIGPNGAGKTSLIDAIFGMAPMRTGRVLLEGRPLGKLPPYRRAKAGLRRTFQGAELFDDLSVWDNVAVIAPDQGRAEYVVQLLGLDPFRSVLARDIPAGVRRRVDLARALAADPKVVLLDEPGAGLSPQDKVAMAAQLNDLAATENLAFLLVDHDVDFVSAACQRTYAMALGQLIASGETSAVLRAESVVESYLGPAVTTV